VRFLCLVHIAVLDTPCFRIMQIRLHILPIYVIPLWRMRVYSGPDGNSEYGGNRITENRIRSIIWQSWSCLCKQRKTRSPLPGCVSRNPFEAQHIFMTVFVNEFRHVINQYINLNHRLIRTLLLSKWK
jgi:hypothetical protein